MFELENNVAHPNKSSRQKYPFSRMQVGDSFYIPPSANLEAVKANAYGYYSRKLRAKFSILQEGDGYRCWRVA